MLDVRGFGNVFKLNAWCDENLDQSDYDCTVMGMIPLWFRYHFHCPKNKLLAILST